MAETNTRTTLLRGLFDAAMMTLLTVAAFVPLAPAYGDGGYWLALAGGVGLGLAIALVAARFRLGALEVAGMIVASYFVFGGLFALRSAAIGGVIPSVATLRDLALGAVFAWKELLTASTPAVGFEQLLVVPYFAGLLITVLAVSFALRLRRYAWALVPVAAGLVFAISFGDYAGLAPTVVGAGMAVAVLVWVSARSARVRADADNLEVVADQEEVNRARLRRAVLIAATVAIAAAGSIVVTTPATGMWQRSVLREQLVPPLELHDYASPLMSFRRYIEDKDSVMFTVSGLPAGATLRVATLDLYDGVVYKVSGAGGPGSGTFNRVGRAISGAPAGSPAAIQVAIKKLGGVWVPDAGYLTGLTASGERADLLTSGLHYNRSTGTVIDTAGLQEGDSFVLLTNLPTAPSEAELAQASVEQITTPAPEMIPDSLQDRLDEAIGGATTPVAKVQAICTYLHDKGYFSHGAASGVTDSLPGHTWKRITDMLTNEQMVGDQEQYAVAAALMAAQAGVPVRVVMGFAPKQIDPNGVTEVKGGDITAWIEVPVEGYGWVAFNPSPPEDKVPLRQEPKPRKKPQPQVPQPPKPPQEPAQLPPEVPSNDDAGDQAGFDWGVVLRILGAVGVGVGVLALVIGPGILMGVAKARRRGARRSAAAMPDRVSGAWSEVIDTVRDIGVKTSPVATRRETAAALATSYPDVGLQPLADRADAVIFGAGEPTEDAAAAYWADIDQVRTQIAAKRTWKQKLLSFFWPVSVISTLRGASLAGTRAALARLPIPGRKG